jgi:hypothetical protein
VRDGASSYRRCAQKAEAGALNRNDPSPRATQPGRARPVASAAPNAAPLDQPPHAGRQELGRDHVVTWLLGLLQRDLLQRGDRPRMPLGERYAPPLDTSSVRLRRSPASSILPNVLGYLPYRQLGRSGGQPSGRGVPRHDLRLHRVDVYVVDHGTRRRLVDA